MKTTMWIGPFPFWEENYSVGDQAFLVRHCNTMRGGANHYDLRDTPPQTNQSFEYRLRGWCGTYNDLSTHGEGAVEVIKIAKNGRLLVQKITGEKLKAMLDEFGFPELMPDEEEAA